MYKRSPLLALALAYFMLSLTGIPPTGGFTAKFGVFGAVINADMTWLAIIAVITSVISAYFYLRVVFYSFMYDGEGEVVVKPAIAAAVVVALVLTFLLGVYPDPFFQAAREAVFSGAQVLAGG